MVLDFLNKLYFITGDLFENDKQYYQNQNLFMENNILSIYNKDIISEVINFRDDAFNRVERIAEKLNLVIKNENMASALVLPNPTKEIWEDFDEIYNVYADVAIAGENTGFDLIVLNGFVSLINLKAALIAVKENTSLPIMIILSGDETAEESIKSMAVYASSLGVDLIGFKLLGGYERLCSVLKAIRNYTKVPFMALLDKDILENTKDNSDKIVFKIYNEIIETYGVSVIGLDFNCDLKYGQMFKKAFDANMGLNFGGIGVSSISTASKVVNLNDFKIVGKPSTKGEGFSVKKIAEEVLRLKNEGAEVFFLPMEALHIKREDELKDTFESLKKYEDIPLIIYTKNIFLAESAMRMYDGKPGIYVKCSDINNVKDYIDLAQRFGAALFVDICADSPVEAEYDSYRKNYYIAGMISDIWRLQKHLIYRDLILGMSVEERGNYKSLKNIQTILKRIHLNQNCTSFCNFNSVLEKGSDDYEKYCVFSEYILDRGCTVFFAEKGIAQLKKSIRLYREIFDV